MIPQKPKNDYFNKFTFKIIGPSFHSQTNCVMTWRLTHQHRTCHQHKLSPISTLMKSKRGYSWQTGLQTQKRSTSIKLNWVGHNEFLNDVIEVKHELIIRWINKQVTFLLERLSFRNNWEEMSFKTYLFLGFFANPSQESAQTVENDFGKMEYFLSSPI